MQGDIEQVDFYADQDVGSYQDETWYQSGASWLKVTPWGMRQAITWASRRSGDDNDDDGDYGDIKVRRSRYLRDGEWVQQQDQQPG